jgi:methyl-accepting chemotaxis protein
LVSGLPVGTTRQRFLRALLLGGTALDGIGALDALSEVAADAGGSGADEDTIELF